MNNTTRELFRIIGVFLILVLYFYIFTGSEVYADDFTVKTTSVTIPGQYYELSDGEKYNYRDIHHVSQMSYGRASMGRFVVSGCINDTTKRNGIAALGVDHGVLTFSYEHDGSMLNTEATEWHLIDDGDKQYGAIKLNEKIQKGLMTVQSSSDGINWNDVVDPVVNIFGGKSSELISFYTTNGAHLLEGCYYRVTIAYRTKIEKGTRKIGPISTIIPETLTKRNVEVYTFSACMNNGVISIHNLKSNVKDIVTDEYSLQAIRRGETLIDGASTIAGFSIDKLGSSCTVRVNGKTVNSGASFTKNGKYNIDIETTLGKKTQKTVFIFNGNKDNGLSTFFDERLIKGNRVFREGKYPTYAKGAYAYMKSVDSSTPYVTGEIRNLSDGRTITVNNKDRKERKIVLPEGTYRAELYSGDISSGSVFHYIFNFIVIGEDSRPCVNYNALFKSDRLSDLKAKHYEVVYQTTAGGYITVCFSNYDNAFAYAYEIEKRYIEIVGDNVYYKSEENENVKERYGTVTAKDRIRLTNAINYYASRNVEVAYFSRNEKWTYQTLDNEEMLKDLESLSLDESVRVFPSAEEKSLVRGSKVFLNEYTFIHVEDYDVVSVEAYCKKNQKTYLLNFEEPIESQLTVSSEYTITETNEYGNKTVYDAWYMANNETVSTCTKSYNGEQSSVILSSQRAASGDEEIIADYFRIESAEDMFDENAVVTIKAPGIYKFDIKCLVSEIRGLTLYKRGKYHLIFSDIVGNTYSFDVNITGTGSREGAILNGGLTYTDFYNTLYCNDKNSDED